MLCYPLLHRSRVTQTRVVLTTTRRTMSLIVVRTSRALLPRYDVSSPRKVRGTIPLMLPILRLSHKERSCD